MLKKVLNLGKALNRKEQLTIKGGGVVFVCTALTEGCTCFDTPDGSQGFCSDGVCYDC
ncbi:hypothetical protein [Spongiimicrobium salis]|uniref:hypothetical protein n=1 Tax=Spongiimicrobium salis TaxID=1667022 RepID=UPI00374D5ED5